MKGKKLAKTVIAAFASIFVMELLIHQVWLGPFYRAHAQWWRPQAEMESLMPLMSVAQFVLALLLTLIYAKGYEKGKGTAEQGARFGLLIGALLMVPTSLMNYVIYPYPSSLILSWLVAGILEVTVAGAVIGAVYKPGK